jgi:tetratricopeptide (TPR) repeat protein
MQPGSSISHYEIAEKLGEGAMGEVYKARDLRLPRFVALKFLRPSLCESQAQLARFEQEARVVATLSHPNIATIHDIDHADGRHFLAFEYLPGGTLKLALDQLKAAAQQISLTQGLEYAIQLADALGYAHRQGIVHRDVKTANLMFTDSGTLKLTDFGLAKIGGGTDVTQPGTVMGTPATMSPEQAQGQEADERSDVFSAGAVMFELFSGQQPFKGSTPSAVMYQVVHGAPSALGELRPEIPLTLGRIIAKALQKDPASRYQNAAGLASDLRALQHELLIGISESRTMEDTIILPTSTTTGSQVSLDAGGWWRRCSRRHLTVAGGSLAVLVGFAAWFGSSAPPTRLAILPFKTLGTDPKDQILAEGLREILIARLTGLERPGGLQVVVAAEDNADKPFAPSEARGRFGATMVLTGSLIHGDQPPQVVLRLQDTRTLEERGSETIELSGQNVAGAGREIARRLQLGIAARARLALASLSAPPSDALRFYVEAQGLLRSHELDAAERAFRDTLARAPKYGPAWAGLAEATYATYKQRKDPALLTEAAQHANHALQIDKSLTQARIVTAQIERDRGNRDAAIQQLNAALAIEPSNATAYRILGKLYEDERKYDDAERTYRKAIAMRPDDPSGYTSLGVFFYHRNNQDFLAEAERNLLKAVELAPDDYAAHYNLSAVYYRFHRYEAAIKEAEKSAAISPSDGAYGNLGSFYYYSKQYDKAVEAFRKGTEYGDANYQSWGDLADACRWEPSCKPHVNEYYRRAISLVETQELPARPSDPMLHADLAMYANAIGDHEKALDHIARALAFPNAPPEVQSNAILVYEGAGRRTDALNALSQLRAKAPNMLSEIWSSPAYATIRRDARFGTIAGPKP